MKKIVIYKAGSYEQLRMEDMPDPKPGPDEVLIDVRAIGVNYADVIVRMGLYSSAREFVGWPITPGFAVSGVVEQCGERVEAVREASSCFSQTCPAFLRSGGLAACCLHDRMVRSERARAPASGSEGARAFRSGRRR